MSKTRWSKKRSIGLFGISLLALLVLSATSLLALDLPEYTLRYDSKGKVISIENNTVTRDLVTIQSNSLVNTRQYIDPKEAESKAIMSSDSFLLGKGEVFGLKNVSSEIHPTTVTEDRIGNRHVRYEQRLSGIPVRGGEIITHLNKANEVISVNGKFISNLTLSTTAKIKADKALKIAKKNIQSLNYWRSENAISNRSIRKKCRNSSDSKLCVLKAQRKFEKAFGFYSVGSPKLVISAIDTQPVLSWELRLANVKEFGQNYLIDAITGQIIKRESGEGHLNRRIFDCADPLGDTACYINFEVFYGAGVQYYHGRSEGEPVRGAIPQDATANYIGSDEVDQLYNLAGDIHEFYENKFGRNGGNGQGGTNINGSYAATESRFVAHANLGSDGGNCNFTKAWFTPAGTVKICKGRVYNDVVMHEYSHLVAATINTSGGLLLSGQSGALNEAFDDIIGESFELSKTGSIDWKTGNAADPSGITRDHADPPSINYSYSSVPETPFPDRFNSPNFFCGTQDSGGIHTNSTVVSKTIYLASVGGSFNGCDIQGIGLDKVEQILYHALTTHYTSDTSFNDAALYFFQSCNTLVGNFGITSSDCLEVEKATQATEMDQDGLCGPNAPTIPVCAQQQFSADFNLSGTVDLADYQILRGTWDYAEMGQGQRLLAAPPSPIGDANNDGLVGDADYNIFSTQFAADNPGAPMPKKPTMVGDYDFDGDLDTSDFTVWKTGNGQTGLGLEADGNVDGEVNQVDLTMWASHFPGGFAGDYDGNGTVGLEDWDELRRYWNQSLVNMPSDVDKNGIVAAFDYEVWASVYNQPVNKTPPLPTLSGDCFGLDANGDAVVGNGWVDGNDFLGWQRSFGSVGPAQACDHNVDGSLDAADYVVWRDNYGASIFPPNPDVNGDNNVDFYDYHIVKQQFLQTGQGLQGDINRDNVVDLTDFNIWKDRYTEINGTPPLVGTPTGIPGDIDLDGDTDGNDFLEWQRSFGSTGPGLPGDLNYDLSVNAADYTVWRDNYGS